MGWTVRDVIHDHECLVCFCGANLVSLCTPPENGESNLQPDIKCSFVWALVWLFELLIFGMRWICVSFDVEKHQSCDSGGSDQGQDTGVMSPEATWPLYPFLFKTLHHLYVKSAVRHLAGYFIANYSLLCCTLSSDSRTPWHPPPIPFPFLYILFVGVSLSEWNTEGKLGQYSPQLKQRQLSFRSPPHPHIPGACHWKYRQVRQCRRRIGASHRSVASEPFCCV